MLRVFLYMSILLLLSTIACHTGPSPDAESQSLSTPKTVNQSEPQPPVRFLAGVKERSLDGQSMRLDVKTNIELRFPAGRYVYLFSRTDDKLSPLKKWWLTPQSADNIYLSLQDSEVHDAHWFAVTSEQPLVDSDHKKLQQLLANAPIRDSRSGFKIPKPWMWHISSVTYPGDKIDFLTTIEIASAPFSLQMFVQRQGKGAFNKFSSQDSLEPEDRWQVRVDTYRDVHLAVFLRNGKGVVTPLLPGKNVTDSALLKANTAVSIPTKGSIAEGYFGGPKYLCFFCDDRPLPDGNTLRKWLSSSNPAQMQHVALGRGYRRLVSKESVPVPAPLYWMDVVTKTK